MGDNAIWTWFEKWGYDRDLYLQEARTFMLTIHSLQSISISIEEATIKKDLEEIVNRQILEQFGEVFEERPQTYKLLQKFCD